MVHIYIHSCVVLQINTLLSDTVWVPAFTPAWLHVKNLVSVWSHFSLLHLLIYLEKSSNKVVRSKLASLPPPPPSVQYFTAGVDALPAKNNPPQQRVFEVQQPKPEVQLPPPQAHPHYHHPTPSPSHQEKAPRLLSLHDEAEHRFDQPKLSQLDSNASTTSRMDGSGSGSESGGWRREGG